MSAASSREQGSAPLIAVLMMLGICFILTSFLSNQTINEYDAELHQDLNVDRIYVKSAIRSGSNCSTEAEKACVLGQRVKIFTKAGVELVNDKGTSRIGKWNVKVECFQKKAKLEFFVFLSRLDSGGQILNDPLTKKPLDSIELSSLKDICPSSAVDPPKLFGNTCFGFESGTAPLPDSVNKICNGCKFTNRYCGDNQVPFPICPTGFQRTFHYIDRYGWGGIDLTKYTLCKKL